MKRGVCFLFALVACGGSSNNGAPAGDGGASAPPGSLPTLPDGGTLPAVSCGGEPLGSIAGSWDVIGSRAGSDQSTAALHIDATSFSFAANGSSLTFTVSGSTMTLVWRSKSKEVPINVMQTASPLDVGALPLAVGGQWTFRSTEDAESCTSSVGANGFNATCNDVRSTPFGTLNGTVVGQRRVKLASIFGELGGSWHLAGNGSGGVDATIVGSTFTAVVSDAGRPLGRDSWVTVKVCEGTAAGKTSDGYEFAATRQ